MCQPGRPRPQGLSQPGWSAVRRLPQHEVGGVALVGGDVDPGAGDLVVAVAAREAAVGRHRGHVEQDVALGGVGVAALDQRRDQRDHAGMCSVARGSWVGGRQPRAARSSWNWAVVRSVRARMVSPFFARLVDDLVVDVGDVADIDDVALAVEMAQQTEKHVEDDEGARIADMDALIDRRAADIEADTVGIDRLEHLLGARQRVVQLELHARPRQCWMLGRPRPSRRAGGAGPLAAEER